LEAQECQLIKSRKMREFNNQFYDTMKRGVFRKLSMKEMADYTELVNYFTMVEPVQNGPHTTMPLCFCMNINMKQSRLSGKSLKDCLTNGTCLQSPWEYENTGTLSQRICPNSTS
jgi:hypothetical protein